jgi:L-threonylcarbamoyladenylate synthase
MYFEGVSPEAVDACTSALYAGGIALAPADTVYGFFGRADVPAAVERVYEIKQRDRGKPFVVYTDERDVRRWAELTSESRLLIDRFWPAALALVLRKTSGIPDWFTNGSPTIAVMTASNSLISDVIRGVDAPLFGTTVNYSGEPSIKRASEALCFRDSVDVMVADDTIPVYNKSSTIVDCTVCPPVIIREEAISAEEVRAVFPDVEIDFARRK